MFVSPLLFGHVLFCGKCIPCFHLLQSLSFIDDSNPGSPSSDISGLVAEPNLSGRSHTLIFSSSEVSGLLVAHSSLKPLQDDPCAAERGRSQACSLSLPPFVAEICECWGHRRKMHVCVCVWSRFVLYGNMFFGLAFVEVNSLYTTLHSSNASCLDKLWQTQTDVDCSPAAQWCVSLCVCPHIIVFGCLWNTAYYTLSLSLALIHTYIHNTHTHTHLPECWYFAVIVHLYLGNIYIGICFGKIFIFLLCSVS